MNGGRAGSLGVSFCFDFDDALHEQNVRDFHFDDMRCLLLPF